MRIWRHIAANTFTFLIIVLIGAAVAIGCLDGAQHDAVLTDPPYYDRAGDIPRGRLVDIPER